MTLLGKIFTVMVLIMSCVFMTAAVTVYATHRNWEKFVNNDTPSEKFPLGLVQQLAQQKQKYQDLTIERDNLKKKLATEQAARRGAVGGLQTKLLDVRREVGEKEARIRELDSAMNTAAAASKMAEETVAGLRKEVALLRGEIQVAQEDRDVQFEKVVMLTDQLHAARGVEQNLRERQKQLIDQVTEAQRVMQIFGLNPKKSYDGIAPELDGIVTAVGDRDLIEVSLGSDDGLLPGARLEVFRDNSYLGYAIVLKTNPDRAVAKIDEKSKRGLIKEQDRVATKLSRTRAS